MSLNPDLIVKKTQKRLIASGEHLVATIELSMCPKWRRWRLRRLKRREKKAFVALVRAERELAAARLTSHEPWIRDGDPDPR